MKRLTLVALAALMLVGCGPSLSSGEVLDKEYVPMFVTVVPVYCGKGCMVTQVIVHPETWSIWVCDGDSLDADRTCDWWHVSETTYNETNIGEKVTR